ETVVAAATRAHGLRVLNAAPARPLPQELLDAIDLLVVNETEATAIVPASRPGAGLRAALLRVVPRVAITIGADGVLYADRDGAHLEVAAPKVTAVDTTAAGHTFTGVLAAAPDDPRVWDEWRRQLHRWREDARARIGYSGARYERADLAWTQRCFSVGLLWLWDEQLYDYKRQTFTVDGFLEHDADLGGYDAVVLWHTYPLIGIDERDQFDFYKQVPELPAVVRAFHDRGVRVFM